MRRRFNNSKFPYDFFWSIQCYLSFPILSSFYPPTSQFMPSISIIPSSKPLYQWILSSVPWIYLLFLWLLSNFLAFMDIPDEIHTSKVSKLVSTNERNEWLFFWVLAIPLRMIVFNSCKFYDFIFHNSQVIFHCVNTLIFIIHSSVDVYLGLFHVLAIMNRAAMNKDDQVCLK